MQLRWNWKRWPLAAVAILLAGANAFAHEKWFVDPFAVEPAGSIFAYVDSGFALAVGIAAAALFLLLVWLDRKLDGSRLSRWIDARLLAAPFNPRTVLGVCIGVALMGAGLNGTLFAPNLVLPGSGWGIALGIFQICLGSLFLFLEPAYAELGLLLGLLYLAGFAVLPAADLLEELLFLGAGVFFVMSASRPSWLASRVPERERLGYQAFRIIMGLGLLVLASVKWLHPELGLAVVAEYRINFLAGFGGTDAQFVYAAALIETLVALCILLRVAFRPAVAFAFFFFMISIYFLGFRELLGHLPIKASLFLFFVYGHWHKGERKA